jgi:myo-inositol-1-phosphate synthase
MQNNLKTVLKVNSPNVVYDKNTIQSSYTYHTQTVSKNEKGELLITPRSEQYQFRTETTVPKLGMMVVGLGGNNGSTITGAIEANRRNITWTTKDGVKSPNYFGSITQSSTVQIGVDEKDNDVYVPLGNLLPMVHPNDIVIGGWDINNVNFAQAMERACVFDYDL